MTNEATMIASEEQKQMPSPQPGMSEEDRSKDAFFIQLAAIAEAMIAAHGNSLRAIVKHLDEISDEDIAGVNIPTGIPLVYELDEETLKPIKKGGTYLDPEAEAKIAAVANQGK